ncbi:unnamed protein product, partial [Prorocentrum cordatum]
TPEQVPGRAARQQRGSLGQAHVPERLWPRRRPAHLRAEGHVPEHGELLRARRPAARKAARGGGRGAVGGHHRRGQKVLQRQPGGRGHRGEGAVDHRPAKPAALARRLRRQRDQGRRRLPEVDPAQEEQARGRPRSRHEAGGRQAEGRARRGRGGLPARALARARSHRHQGYVGPVPL